MILLHAETAINWLLAPAQMTNAPLSGTGVNIASNTLVNLPALQKQAQFQQFPSLTNQQLQNHIIQQQQKSTMSAAAMQAKHHRRSSAADPNK